ncbi:hypothetical protein POMI540_2824 [Schizosaccharomyces pombe]
MRFSNQITILVTISGKIGQMYMMTYEKSVMSPVSITGDMSTLPEIGVRTLLGGGGEDDIKSHWAQITAGQVGSLLARQQMLVRPDVRIPRVCLGLHVPWTDDNEKNGDLTVVILELVKEICF